MATYNNDYSKEEDETMWELHEIRHKLATERTNKSIEEINSEGRKLFDSWTKHHRKAV